MIKNIKVALIIRSIFTIYALIGLFVSLGVFALDVSLTSFLYYTYQSNIIVVSFMIYTLVKTILSYKSKEDRLSFNPRLQMVITIAILVTFIVYWTLLAPTANTNLFTFGNLAVHAIIPIIFLIDYIIFNHPGHLKYRDVYYVLIYPLFYLGYSVILGLSQLVVFSVVDGTNVYFPYFFLDINRYGLAVLIYVVVLIIIFIGISHLFYIYDNKSKRGLTLSGKMPTN